MNRADYRGQRGFGYVQILWYVGVGIATWLAYENIEPVRTAVNAVGEYVVGLLQPAIDWLEKQASDGLAWVSAQVRDFIPEDYVDNYEKLGAYLGVANYVFCLQFGVSLLIVRYLILGGLGFIRFMKSWIPTVSG